MNRRQTEWSLAVLSLGGAIITLLAGAFLLPFDTRPQMLAAALMGVSLWLIIGFYPGRR